jgi:hypothetical protein
MKLSLPRISIASGLLALAAGIFLPAPVVHADAMTFPFLTAAGGTTAQAAAMLSAGIENGLAYFNIHTMINPAVKSEANWFPSPVQSPVLAFPV